jgi:hypothetical protein
MNQNTDRQDVIYRTLVILVAVFSLGFAVFLGVPLLTFTWKLALSYWSFGKP